MKLLKFEADWCGPCREMGRRLEKFNDCEVMKINVDDEENQDIVGKYGIRNIPVIILLDDDERNGLYFLVGGKSLITLIAYPAPSDGTVIIGRPGIYNSGILMTAKRAFHKYLSSNFLFLKEIRYFQRFRIYGTRNLNR